MSDHPALPVGGANLLCGAAGPARVPISMGGMVLRQAEPHSNCIDRAGSISTL